MSYNIFKNWNEIDVEDYILVTYFLESKTTLKAAAWELAIGQSVGNPNVRNSWETDELFDKHSAIVVYPSGDHVEIDKRSNGIVTIGFPKINLDWDTDGVSQLLCFMMGGQMDIDNITKCQAMDISFPLSIRNKFLAPKYGLTGFREFANTYNKPFFGGIVKPKTGISSDVLLEMVKEMVEGGVNFIKEDEIMANPSFCPIEERVPKVMEYLKDKNVIYSVCINSDPMYVLERVKKVYELGGNSVHINFWSGLGVYKSIRELDLPIFIHFQKSGDKTITNKTHDYHISWNIICKLAAAMGVDSIHAGMFGGYLNDSKRDLLETMNILHSSNVIPALSCGMNPGLIDYVNENVGIDYMANVGGALHGHPGGTIAGCKAMRQAIDGKYEEEYYQAIQKWGKK
jgi:ribulose 1,5-bisphosphate carboxylase large subunit-like protein